MNLEDHQLRFTSSVKITSKESIKEFFADLKVDLEERFKDAHDVEQGESSVGVHYFFMYTFVTPSQVKI